MQSSKTFLPARAILNNRAGFVILHSQLLPTLTHSQT